MCVSVCMVVKFVHLCESSPLVASVFVRRNVTDDFQFFKLFYDSLIQLRICIKVKNVAVKESVLYCACRLYRVYIKIIILKTVSHLLIKPFPRPTPRPIKVYSWLL